MNQRLSVCFLFAIAIILLLSAEMPRALSILPELMGAGFYLAYRRQAKIWPPLPKELLYICVFTVILGAVSSLWALDPQQALERTWKTALILLPCCLLAGFTRTVEIEKIGRSLWLVPAALTLAALIVAIEMTFKMPLYHLTHGIAFGVRVQPHEMNRAAITTILCYFPALAMAAATERKRLWQVLLTAPVVAIFFLTESQSYQLALILGALFMFAFPYNSRIAWGFLGGITGAAVAFAPWLSTGIFSLLTQHVNTLPSYLGTGGANLGARLEIWDFISRYTLQNPLYGFGMEAARAVPGFDTARLYHHAATILHPHNFALQLWIEFGVIGATLGIVTLTYIMRGIYRLSPKQQRVALPAFISTLMVAGITYGLWQGWWLGLLFLVGNLTILAIKTAAPEAGSGHVLSPD